MVSRNLSNLLFGSGVAIAMGMTAAAPAKAWIPLMPDAETAVDVTITPACSIVGPGVTPDSIYGVESITSQTVANQPTEGADISSCLVVDNPATETTFGSLTLVTKDAGTNDKDGDLWYRPIARNAASNAEEKGRLEYGEFTFVLDDEMVAQGGKLKFTFLDIEASKDPYGVLGTPPTGVKVGDTFHNAFYEGTKVVGTNDVRHYLVLDMVKEFTVYLGRDTSGTGDGVNFRVEAKATPEPSAMLGLGLAVGALATARKRRLEND
ncbi:MAG: LEVG family PEP-CTERM protein [Cyanobacteria bacterium]|nr:LEVG family PEP-CTERM protein [Cyanobacteriota bacterium]